MSTTKRDPRKRDPRKEEFWRRQIDLWRQGDLSVRAFCRLRGLSEPSFHGWRRTLKQRDADRTRTGARAAGAASAAFVPVRIVTPADQAACSAATADEQAAAGLELLLAGGRRLRVGPAFDAATLRRLLGVLEEANAEGTPCY